MADNFAKFGLSLDYCSNLFHCIPYFASAALRADCMGICFPRGF